VGFEPARRLTASSGFKTELKLSICKAFVPSSPVSSPVTRRSMHPRSTIVRPAACKDERNGSSRRVPSHEETPAVRERLESQGVPGRPSVKCLLAAVVNRGKRHPRAGAKQAEREIPEVRGSTSKARTCPSSGAEEPFIGGLGGLGRERVIVTPPPRRGSFGVPSAHQSLAKPAGTSLGMGVGPCRVGTLRQPHLIRSQRMGQTLTGVRQGV
jgi:hypothetical protein